jgi:hypothetical protein
MKARRLSTHSILLPALATIAALFAVEASAEMSPEELAKATQNPVADLISLPFQNNINFGVGPKDNVQNILNVQPVIPIDVGDRFNIITRTILPIVSNPTIEPGDNRKSGLGDTTFTAFLSPQGERNDLTWGIGPIINIPTATDNQLGNKRWALGPSVVAIATPGDWVVGALISNLWDVGGNGNNDTNLFTFQPIINYNLPSFYLTATPVVTANWENSSDDTWTVPVGGGIGKVWKFGGPPINTQIQAFYNVEKPPGSPEWQLRIQVQLLFPKKKP